MIRRSVYLLATLAKAAFLTAMLFVFLLIVPGRALTLTWFFIAMLVGLAAAPRGRSRLTWWIVALIASPLIGCAALFLLPRKDEAIRKRQIKSGIMRQCPECAELVRVEARRCHFCGAMLTDQAAQIPMGIA